MKKESKREEKSENKLSKSAYASKERKEGKSSSSIRLFATFVQLKSKDNYK